MKLRIGVILSTDKEPADRLLDHQYRRDHRGIHVHVVVGVVLNQRMPLYVTILIALRQFQMV